VRERARLSAELEVTAALAIGEVSHERRHAARRNKRRWLWRCNAVVARLDDDDD
jgi:hypothetical protein